MKNNLLILSLAILVFATCKKDKKFTPDCSGGAKSYTSDVSPIIASHCARSGCHAAGSSNGPGPLTSHSQVSAAKDRIRPAVANGSMPKDHTLSDDEKNKIICWIDAGAQNN